VSEKKSTDLFDNAPVPLQETEQSRQAEAQPAEEYSADTITEEEAVATETQTGDAENLLPKSGALQKAYPRYRLNTPPTYPNLARKRGHQGTVVLQVFVNRQGRIDDIRLDESSGYSMLDRAAVNAVKKWIFEPGRRNNKTVSMWVRVPVTFRLKN
jgi:protein TonB